MARTGKSEHPRILQMVDNEHRKVAEVAAEYGCTPANIYALLAKLRREVSRGAEAASALADPAETLSLPAAEKQPSSEAVMPEAMQAVPDLFAFGSQPEEALPRKATGGKRRAPSAVEVASTDNVETSHKGQTPSFPAVPRNEPEAVHSLPTRSVVTELPARGTTKRGGGVGATLSKPGMALVMRTADGEENLTPFRSLDDLLSAVKPILRATARSPDAVWFSIHSVDLALLDSDAT